MNKTTKKTTGKTVTETQRELDAMNVIYDELSKLKDDQSRTRVIRAAVCLLGFEEPWPT